MLYILLWLLGACHLVPVLTLDIWLEKKFRSIIGVNHFNDVTIIDIVHMHENIIIYIKNVYLHQIIVVNTG